MTADDYAAFLGGLFGNSSLPAELIAESERDYTPVPVSPPG